MAAGPAWAEPAALILLLLDELQAVGVAFASLSEGIDTTTPAGRLQLHVLGAIAEFERERIRERVIAGRQRARAGQAARAPKDSEGAGGDSGRFREEDTP